MVNSVSLNEAMLQLVNHEDKLFESLLKLEYRKAQILKEDGNVSSQKDPDEGDDAPTVDYAEGENVDDETKKNIKSNIFARIKEAIKRVAAAIAKAFKNLFEALRNIVTKDNTIVKKYADAINQVENRKGYPGIRDFRAANPNFEFKPVFERFERDIIDNFISGSFYDGMGDVADSTFGQAAEAYNNDNVFDKAFLPGKDLWVPDANFKIADNVFSKNRGEEIDRIGKIAKKMNLPDDKIDTATKKVLTIKTKDNKNMALNKKDTGTNVWSEALKLAMSASRNLISTYQEWFKSLRRMLFDLGTYCLSKRKDAFKAATATDKKEDKKPVNASFVIDGDRKVSIAESLCWIAGEESDNYVNEMFGLV